MRCPECGCNFPETALMCTYCGLSREEALDTILELGIDCEYPEEMMEEDYTDTEIPGLRKTILM